MIQDNPMTGVGLHNFKPLMPRYAPGESVVTLAHNTYIELTAELGVPGVLAFVAVLVTSFRRLNKVRRSALRNGRGELAILALGLQAGIISFAGSAIFLTAWWDKLVWLLIFSGFALDRLSRRTLTKIPRKNNTPNQNVAVHQTLPLHA